MLGRFPLPIEIAPFGATATRRAVEAAAAEPGCPGPAVLRKGQRRPCFRHGWRALAARRPVAAHRRPAWRSRRGLLRSRASWSTACSSASRGLLFSPVRTGFASSSGPDLKHKGSAPMIARFSACVMRAWRALIALARDRHRSAGRAQAPAAAHQPSPAAILLAKQIVDIKGRQRRVPADRARRGRKDQERCSCRPISCGRRTSTRSRSSCRSNTIRASSELVDATRAHLRAAISPSRN